MHSPPLDRTSAQTMAIDFLKGTGRDNNGRKVDQYLKMQEYQLEVDHEWIQWAFPISTVSPHNPDAGMIFETLNPQNFFKGDSPAYINQQKLLIIYLDSIGITHVNDLVGYDIDLHKFFNVVDNKYNHHMKRLSRVLKHLKLTEWGYMTKGKDLYECLMRNAVKVNPDGFDQKTLYIWAAIAGGFDD